MDAVDCILAAEFESELNAIQQQHGQRIKEMQDEADQNINELKHKVGKAVLKTRADHLNMLFYGHKKKINNEVQQKAIDLVHAHLEEATNLLHAELESAIRRQQDGLAFLVAERQASLHTAITARTASYDETMNERQEISQELRGLLSRMTAHRDKLFSLLNSNLRFH